ncbi:MAG TPA: TIGR03943 family protein [Actinomycetota bacterium]|nr:TIGR03943 family protein [Actinomycetota bacterium]
MSDRRRIARGVALACWAGFFAWLHVSGEKTRYLGPRTYWVVVFGTVVLGVAAAAHFVTARGAPRRRLEGRDAWGIVALLVPLLAVAAVPSANLGALAASRKSSGAGAASVGAIAPPAPEAGDEISFAEIHYAGESEEYAAEAGIAEGMEVELTGFVTHPDGLPADTLGLTRFHVSCCAADAIPYTVPLALDPASRPDDVWLRVEGRLALRDGVYVVEPESVAAVDAPTDPYLY